MSERHRSSAHDTKSNRHHCLPRSRFGSNDSINISRPTMARHEDFHHWSGYREIGYLTRLMAMYSIGTDGTTMEPESVLQLFETTGLRRWKKMYDERAFRERGTPGGAQAEIKGERHTITHLNEEYLCTRRLLDGVANGTRTRLHTTLRYGEALDFFHVDGAQHAIRKLYTEQRGGEFLWTKPLIHSARSKIIDIVKDARMRRLADKGVRRDLERVLSIHEHGVGSYLQDWLNHHDALTEYLGKIREGQHTLEHC